ncbi:DAK2 domain-containing protein [[Mycoplasma] anseris]|uniref:DAK2 domain-containing protein n=1 Tax=[Mycoplasma] anseris TaxID=92400 RepID=A0A2Z4NCZ8_9BACT|nr:DAK2 domain-containing protein [[Mycoplasma] anseris]AWX69430.1 DAK2 domain-containing protein [[Mycoplasma] anseris]
MNKISGQEWKMAVISAANNIENKKNAINALNVFPVPDGDTGTNMASTIMNAQKEIQNVTETNLDKVAKSISQHMLLGARGNSGVILSQIFRGFANGFNAKTSATPIDMVFAFEEATKSAYSAVLKPIEGTILTVIREVSEGLKKSVNANTTFEQLFKNALVLARTSCDNTPKLLKVLREVGVTDSGGEGLFAVIEGIYQYFIGEPVTISEQEHSIDKFISDQEVFNGEFGYCTEFLLELNKPGKFDKENLTRRLERIGNSMVVIVDESILKVHIHTKKPGDVLNTVNSQGQFLKVKIDNMTLQANDSKQNSNNISNKKKENDSNNKQAKPLKGCALISCNTGQGMIGLVKANNVDYVIEGGQTNNPSIKEIVEAIKSIDARTIFILPNNSNITLSAQQASTIVSNKKVIILPTKSQAQCLPVSSMFSPENSEKDNHILMKEIIKTLKYGEIAPSIKDTKLNGIKIKNGDYMVIANNKLISTASNANQAAIKLLRALIDEESQQVTIIYGQDASEADAKEIQAFVEMNYDVDVKIYEGNQTIYPFYISVE